MKQLAVSRKFRKTIIEKISSSFQGKIADRLIVLADRLMTDGLMPDLTSDDQMTQSIFKYISSDIMTAIERSRKARQRAAERKQQKQDTITQDEFYKMPRSIYVEEYDITLFEGEDFVRDGFKFKISPKVRLTRQQRRQVERDLEHAERMQSRSSI
ncbi:MAG: hypothetical protein NC098_09215 [Lachnoclostridium sp.]|nr:hypothetical protein [Lachnoclostridium sp.]